MVSAVTSSLNDYMLFLSNLSFLVTIQGSILYCHVKLPECSSSKETKTKTLRGLK